MTQNNLTPDAVHASLDGFIRCIALVPENDPNFTSNADLFDTGYLDSLGIVALTTHIEQTFHTTLNEQDLFDPRFCTIDGMVELITSRQQAPQR